MLALFDLPVEGVGRHFLRVAVATVSTMLTQQRGLAVRYLFNAMAAVLISLSSGERTVVMYYLHMFYVCNRRNV